jgi:hypothetical protein
MNAVEFHTDTSPLSPARLLLATALRFCHAHPGCRTEIMIQATRILETYFRGSGAKDGVPLLYGTEQYYQGAPETPKMLTLREAAAVTGMQPRQLYRLYARGEVTAFVIDHHLLFSYIDLLEWRQTREKAGEDGGA